MSALNPLMKNRGENPSDNNFRNNTHDGNRPSGRK